MLLVLGYPVALLALLTGWALSGCLVERALAREVASQPSVERWLLRLGLGVALWMLVSFLLAASGLLSPVVLGVTLLSVSALGAMSAARSRSRAESDRGNGAGEQASRDEDRDGDRDEDSSRPRHRLAAAALAAPLLAVLAVLMLQAMRPDVSHDASVYHLTLPRLFLEHGGFYRVPFNVYSNWPMGVELLFGMAMALFDYVAAKTVHFGFGVVTLALTARLAGRGYGLFAAAVVLFNPVVLYEIRIAYVDLASAFLLLAAAWMLSQALDAAQDSQRRRGRLWLAGVLGGALCAVKLNGFFGPMVLLAMHALWHLLQELRAGGEGPLHRAGKRMRGWLAEALRLGAPSLLFGAPWLIKSWIFTGNPVYPLLYDVFGGPEWSSRLADQHGEWQRAIGMGRSPVDFLLLPLRVILYGDFGYQSFDGQIHLAWLVLLPLGLAAVRKDALARRFLGVAGLYFVLWALSSQQMRFLIPVLPLLAVAAARGVKVLLDRCSAWRRSELWPTAARLGLTAVVMALLVHSAWIYVRQSGRLAGDLVAHGPALKEAVVHPAFRWIDEQLPPDARLLLINTNRGFFVRRAYLADSFFEASQISDAFGDSATATDTLAVAHRLGVTHVLVESRPGIAYPPALVEMLQDPGLARVAHRSPDGRFTVLEIARTR